MVWRPKGASNVIIKPAGHLVRAFLLFGSWIHADPLKLRRVDRSGNTRSPGPRDVQGAEWNEPQRAGSQSQVVGPLLGSAF
jgi:hypothetical protein